MTDRRNGSGYHTIREDYEIRSKQEVKKINKEKDNCYKIEFSDNSLDEWTGVDATDDNITISPSRSLSLSFDGHYLAGLVERTFPIPEYSLSSLASKSTDHADDNIDNNTTANDKLANLKVPKRLEIIFLFISFGYMLPWTSLGSLISYYKNTYSANFYVKLYCAYYLPGLPVALLQHRYDSYLDGKFGSRNTYLWRGILSFVSMIIILISMVWLEQKVVLLVLFSLLGVCGWLCHGTASMLASMYPSAAIAYLQTGFRCPEIYTIAAVALLQIGKTATIESLDTFYILSAAVVSIGLVCWIIICRSQTSIIFFNAKDKRNESINDMERMPLLSNKIEKNNDYSKDNPPPKARSISVYNNETSDTSIYSETSGNIDSLKSNNESRIETHDVHKSMDVSMKKQNTSSYKKPIERAKILLRAMEDASMKTAVYQTVWPLCLALIITMWCSIFQASFFAYVDSPQGRDIEQLLYFIRLFSDLAGRPLTRVPRPWFLKKSRQILIAAILRVSLMILFFVYILVPSFPRSDVFICIIVSIFSLLSGYFTVLIYEYAAEDGLDKAAQTYATALLNICFQLAAFTAVLLSVIITSSGLFDKLIAYEVDDFLTDDATL